MYIWPVGRYTVAVASTLDKRARICCTLPIVLRTSIGKEGLQTRTRFIMYYGLASVDSIRDRTDANVQAGLPEHEGFHEVVRYGAL